MVSPAGLPGCTSVSHARRASSAFRSVRLCSRMPWDRVRRAWATGGLIAALAAAALTGTAPAARPVDSARIAPAAGLALAGVVDVFAGADAPAHLLPATADATAVEGRLGFGAPAGRVSTGTVTADVANVRNGPGLRYEPLAHLRKGITLTLIERRNERRRDRTSPDKAPIPWFKVRTPTGATGWVSSEVLDVSSTTPTASAPAAPASRSAVARSSAGWAWPTRGAITSSYGYRGYSLGGFHNGLDIANSKWTTITAARGGRVIQAGWCSGYGYCVMIDHGNGFVSEYGHMASRPPVRTGQIVQPGQLIGYMGSTYDRRGGGYATGNHLHFTLKLNGRAVNPLRYLR